MWAVQVAATCAPLRARACATTTGEGTHPRGVRPGVGAVVLTRRSAFWRCRASARDDDSDADNGPVEVVILPEGTRGRCRAGDSLLDVAERLGVVLPTGCLEGTCGTCEVEIKKYKTQDALQAVLDGSDAGEVPGIVVRGCITRVPPGYALISVNTMFDPLW